jgi:hypothetical protein
MFSKTVDILEIFDQNKVKMDPESEKKFLELLENNSNPSLVREYLLNNPFLSDCQFINSIKFPPEIFYGEIFRKI